MPSRLRLIGLAAGTIALGMLGACSNDDTTAAPTTTQSTLVAPPTSDTTGTGPTTDPSAPSVGGPSIAAPASTPAHRTTRAHGTDCGLSRGPDGALSVKILSGSATCDDIHAVVQQYAPLIATGEPQQIDGWACGLSKRPGVLAMCQKDDVSFGYLP